ncbi:unnamed protein product [Gemmataceae bacterium]|nr:unnamed protein product [Gemmataceae bacterium]VTT96513.1 unnamed protein product [Gemmataceae bacterium]
MTISNLFAYGVAAHLVNEDPGIRPGFVKGRSTVGATFSICTLVRAGGYDVGFAGLHAPRRRELGLSIRIDQPGSEATIIYATREDVFPLTRLAARDLRSIALNYPRPYNRGATGAVALHTARAKVELRSNLAVQTGAMPLLTDLTDGPHVAELFDHADFWSLLHAARTARSCSTTLGALADFVQEHGFEGLAALLRRDPRAGLQVLPRTADRPVWLGDRTTNVPSA